MHRKQSDAFFRIGLPMLILVTGGSVFLSKLLQGKFDIKACNSKACVLSSVLITSILMNRVVLPTDYWRALGTVTGRSKQGSRFGAAIPAQQAQSELRGRVAG